VAPGHWTSEFGFKGLWALQKPLWSGESGDGACLILRSAVTNDGKPKSMAQGRKSHVVPLLLPVIASFFAIGPAAHAQTESSVLRGREVAQRACAGCHAMDGTQGGSIQGTEVASFRAIAGRNWSAERLQAFIMTPHRPMPATPLPLSEVRELVDYILSLR
jgi:mono/diheme cytochrome c family protein